MPLARPLTVTSTSSISHPGRPKTSSKRTLPAQVGSRPQTVWFSVVLPAPLLPSSATTCPRGTLSDSPRSTCTEWW